MGAAKKRQFEIEELSSWADMLLVKHDACTNCETHDEITDNLDAEALDEACKEARRSPPKGLSRDEAEEFVRERLGEIGDECGRCANNRDRD